MAPQRCSICDWPLNFEHAFNVKCAVANAENDQLMAEVEEAMSQPLSPEDEEIIQQGVEIVKEVLALARFNRVMAQYPGTDPT